MKIMTTIFPPKLQKIIDKAVLHLWDKAIPLPDLSSLEEWLETDGWDDVVSGIQGSYIHLSEALEFFNDEDLMEYVDIDPQLKSPMMIGFHLLVIKWNSRFQSRWIHFIP